MGDKEKSHLSTVNNTNPIVTVLVGKVFWIMYACSPFYKIPMWSAVAIELFHFNRPKILPK